MKILLFAILLASAIWSCKKDSTSTPATPTPAVTQTSAPTQDANLIGVWVQDSDQFLGDGVVPDSIGVGYPRGPIHDTIYITENSFLNKNHISKNSIPPYQAICGDTTCTWQTNGDTLIANFGSWETWHYYYSISNNKLFISAGYAWNYMSGNYVIMVNPYNFMPEKSWYHKI